MRRDEDSGWGVLRTMTFSDLETLLLVVRRGSFTAAAEALAISQPAITQRIRRLEKQLGGRLLERGSRPVLPTAAGEKLLDVLPQVYEALIDAFPSTVPEPRARISSLVVATTPFLASAQLPRLVRSFTNRYDAKVKVLDLSYPDVEDAIRMETAHFALLSDYRGNNPSAELIGEVDVVLAAHPSHPLAGEGSIALDQLSDQVVFHNHQYDHLFDRISSAAAEQGLEKPTGTRVQEMSTVVGMVDASLGLGLVTRTVADVHCSPRTEVLEIDGLPLRREYLMLRSEAPLPEELARQFANHVREHFTRDHPVGG